MRRWSVSVLLVALTALAGCGGGGATAEPDPSPTPTVEAVEEATPEQLASVVAGKEEAWREVIDGAADCRFEWVIESDDPVASATRMSCYLREMTIGTTAQTAINDLSDLTPPASMEALVDETTEALGAIAAIDLEAVCGSDYAGPKDADSCHTALGQRNGAYRRLEGALNKWGPYL